MKYLALLRAINVGGKNIIKMADLRDVVRYSGFRNVSTYIQSGNVIFESDETDVAALTATLETTLAEAFDYESRVVLRSCEQLKAIVADVPSEWDERDDLRCYVAFVKEPLTPDEVLQEVELAEGVDFVHVGPGVLYLSTLLSGLTRSGFSKLVGKKIYKDVTIRNYKTTRKLLELMEK